MGTPVGSSHAASMVGHCLAGAVKRAFGCAALTPLFFPISGVHKFPCQSSHSAGGFSVMPSQDRKSTRLNSSHLVISYAVFCLKKKKYNYDIQYTNCIAIRCSHYRSHIETCSAQTCSLTR